MTSSAFRGHAGRRAIIACFCLCLAAPAFGEPVCTTLQPAARQWHMGPGLEPTDEATNISGTACVSSDPGSTCMLIGDNGRSARVFTVGDGVLAPGTAVSLLPKPFKEVDGEGVAYADGAFYVTGSHGLSRHDEKQESRYFVFRIPVDPGTNKLGISSPFDGKTPAPEIKRSDKLAAAITAHPELSRFIDKPLTDQGIDIEGIAARAGNLFFGFRGPVIDGRGFLLAIKGDALFGDGKDAGVLVSMPLGNFADPGTDPTGKGLGVRDLATVTGGLLVLTGPEQDVDGPADLFFWPGQGDDAVCLGRLGAPREPKVKPEALLVLAEGPGLARILVLHDGPPGGMPTEYDVPLPR